MWEHRDSEKVLQVIELVLPGIRQSSDIGQRFRDILEYFRTYADELHHGKEENYLFHQLNVKNLPPDLKSLMAELIDEHAKTREVLALLAQGISEKSADIVKSSLQELVILYRIHIEKEDKHFFFQAMDYLTDAEQSIMLQDFISFDSKIIHDKYRAFVDDLAAQNAVSQQ